VGRVPSTSDLRLEGRVKTDARGYVVVDDELRCQRAWNLGAQGRQWPGSPRTPHNDYGSSPPTCSMAAIAG
jgi:hypothetical protein